MNEIMYNEISVEFRKVKIVNGTSETEAYVITKRRLESKLCNTCSILIGDIYHAVAVHS